MVELQRRCLQPGTEAQREEQKRKHQKREAALAAAGLAARQLVRTPEPDQPELGPRGRGEPSTRGSEGIHKGHVYDAILGTCSKRKHHRYLRGMKVGRELYP